MKTGALLPPTATFTLRLPRVWMLFSSAMQIRCAWLWPECCFSSVSQVHILYANTEVRIFIWSWSNSLFLRPFILSVSVSIFLSQSVFCCCFHFVDKTVFLCSKSSFVVLKVPHLPSSSKTPSIIQHTYLFSAILSSKNVFFHSATILSCPLYIPPPIHKSILNPNNIPLSLWHKTDWGWLVLSWLLRSSTGQSAAGVGGGAGSISGARSTQGQEAGSSGPAKPSGRWTG